MNALASIFCASLIVSCTTDPNAGMVAARITGQKKYLAFSHNGKADSAAVFGYGGHTWLYHPEFGSRIIDGADPASLIPGSFVAPVLCVPEDADLLHGCLPRAIAQVRAHGGHVALSFDGSNAYRVYP